MKVDYSYWQIFYDPDIPLAERVGLAALAPIAVPLIALSGCTSQPQFGNAVFIPSGNNTGSGDLSFRNDGHSQDGVAPDAFVSGDALVGTDSDTPELPPPDATTTPDTPIDIPPQPKLCTTQVTLPSSCNVRDITAGETASCATTQDGSVKCWGKLNKEYAGKLVDLFSSPSPKAMDGFKNIQQTSLYLQHLCGRDTFGQVWCVGQNIWGQLGNGTQTNHSATAVKVLGAANIMQIATGGFHSCAVDTAGAVYCWGLNNNGQLGLGDKAAQIVTQAQKLNFPQSATVSTIALGSFHSAAIHESGATFAWGHNGVKQLGLSGATAKVYNPTFIDKSGYRFSAGDDFSCLIDKGCAVSCAGAQNSKDVFTPIKSLKDAASISANRQHVCAATQDGALYCWGDGVATPTLVNGLAPVVQVAVGAHHTCILDNSCAVYCWGDNSSGQLGNGSAMSSAAPVKVIDL